MNGLCIDTFPRSSPNSVVGKRPLPHGHGDCKGRRPVRITLKHPCAIVFDNDVADQCDRSFVCAVRTTNSEVAILRSYENEEVPDLLYDECKIWEASRATSAATAFFDPISIGPYNQQFADGAVSYNNPIQLVYQEAQYVWPERVSNALILSVGTGSAPGPVFEGNLKDIVQAMKSIVTQTEKTAEDFFSDHQDMLKRNLLFRFNVFHGLADVGLEEHKRRRTSPTQRKHI